MVSATRMARPTTWYPASALITLHDLLTDIVSLGWGTTSSARFRPAFFATCRGTVPVRAPGAFDPDSWMARLGEFPFAL